MPELTPKCLLVVANETVASRILHEAITSRASPETEVVVVAPALNRRLRHWVSDERDARRAAAARLERCLASLARDGIRATGHVGDCDPLLAIDDALRLQRADEIVIATHPEGRSNWLARNLVARARTRVAVPIVHIVVDSGAGHEYLADAGGRPIAA